MSNKKYTWLKSNLKQNADESHPLAFREVDDAHPTGEVWVAGKEVVKAAMTPAVVQAIRNEKVVEVDAPEDADVDKAPADDKKATKVVETDFADDFPHKDLLLSAKVTTVKQLTSMSEPKVMAIKGMDTEKLAEISDYLKAQREAEVNK